MRLENFYNIMSSIRSIQPNPARNDNWLPMMLALFLQIQYFDYEEHLWPVTSLEEVL